MSNSMHDDASTIIPEATAVPDSAAGPAPGPAEDGPPAEETFDGVSSSDETVDGASSEETVDAIPVLAEARPLATPTPATLPAAQAVAVAATGFVAGAATIALVKRHTARKVARRSASRRAVDLLPIVGTRTFLVDVHLIAKPQE
jgi:hypothetical protein